MKSRHNRILPLIPVAALAMAGTTQASLIVQSYTYDTAQPFVWDDPGNVKLTDGMVATSTGYGDPAHVGFYGVHPNPQITFNLGAFYDLATVTLSYHADNQTTGDPPVHYTGFGPENSLGDRLWISVSNNGTDFSTPVSYSPFTGPQGGEVTSSMDVTGMGGEYVRLQVQSHDDAWGSSWIWLSEVSFTQLTAVPEPGSLLALGCLLGSGVCLRSRRRR